MMNKLNKDDLRKYLLNERKNLSQTAISEKSKRIAEIIVNLDRYQQSEKMMLYISTKKEVQTKEIIKSAQKDHKKIYIPLIDRKKSDLIPSLVYDFERELILGELGIAQPKKEFYRLVPPNILDLVIVPGVAFTEKGHRLGRGGGYYDRFLSKLKKDAFTIALAFEMQIVDQIPLEENDIPVDCIITEKRILMIRP